MAEPPIPSPLHYHPQHENISQGSAEQAVCEKRRNNCFDYDMENARPDMGSQCRTDETIIQPHSSFTTPGFTSYSQHTSPQNTEGGISMGKIQLMLQDLYKAATEKVVMENAVLFTALKAESAKVKEELENLQLEVRSTNLCKNVPSDILLKNNCNKENTQNIPKNVPEKFHVSEATLTKPTSQTIPGLNLPDRPEDIPRILATQPAASQKTTMASMAARNAPPKEKLVDWTTVSRNGTKTKNSNSRDKWPSQLKNVEESKRRIIRKSEAKGKPTSTA
ncbi:hypothetical protein EPUL_004682 [Erysiphe pulchra]|uniref:Uncharacterized protein n=1 Tax=Erysiphe pulchra TaxID=225359 RepID=A0A2S4PPR1_9PEZI|nr:hypothetical protein EPUL_004682 [Erysiphe pulchra]